MSRLLRMLRVVVATGLWALSVVASLCAEPGEDARQSVAVGELVSAIQRLAPKEYYLCAEVSNDGNYLDRKISWNGTLPSTEAELLGLLNQAKLRYHQRRQVIILEDEALAGVTAGNPLGKSRPNLDVQGGMVALVGEFGAVAVLGGMGDLPERVGKIALKIPGPVTLDEALAEVTMYYHCEWMVRIGVPPKQAAKPGSAPKPRLITIGNASYPIAYLQVEPGEWVEASAASKAGAVPHSSTANRR